jgi:hypothetical protein
MDVVTNITACSGTFLKACSIVGRTLSMTAKCVNPACATPFRYLRGRRLFLVDSPTDPAALVNLGAMTSAAHFSEFFWLCENCCQSMHVVVEKSGEVILLAGSASAYPPRHPPATAA